MPADIIGRNRSSALWRAVVAVAFLLVILPAVIPVVVTAYVILGGLDIVWQFLTNGEGSRVPGLDVVTRVWNWGFDNLIWAFTGNGERKIIP